ncbi:MAG: hypothetical protein QCI82_04410 [Candidatus Thermoplasmatota archaeon]|nr:hypothetical protein [Candidatus Thermoplasmatota archaeon]
MVKTIRKMDGSIERYSRAKMMRSMIVLGVDKGTARNVVKAVGFKKGMTTRDVRRRIGTSLKKIDPELARRYFTTRDLEIDPSVTGINGNCLMSPETMDRLGVKNGQVVEAYSGWNRKALRAYRIEDPHYKSNAIYLGRSDLGFLEVSGSSLVAVRKMAEA